MTDLQKQLYDKIKQLDKEEEIYNHHHRLAKRKKQNVLVPLQAEVRDLLIKVRGERQSNYNLKSE